MRLKRNVFNRIFNVALGLFLSGTIQLKRIRKNLGEFTIQKDLQLDCDFSERCRWFSESEQDLESGLSPWNMATGKPDPILWFAATGTNRQPTSPFAYLTLHNGRGEMLTSGIIKCQKGSGLLTFQYWFSSSASAFVCVLASDSGKQIHCSHPLQRSPGHATIKILGPILQSFKLAIIGSGQGFIIVDNIRYSGDVSTKCPQPVVPELEGFDNKTINKTDENETQVIVEEEAYQVLGGSVTSWSLDDFRNSTFLSSGDDLICDLNPGPDAFPCRWGPNNGSWELIGGEPDPVNWKEEMGTETMPNFPAIGIVNPKTSMVSDPIVCQKVDSQVILSWWATKSVVLKVCAISFPQGTEITCSQPRYRGVGDEYPGPVIFEFPGNIFGPFTWEIKADWPEEDNGIVVLDDIAYFAEVCSVAPFFQEQQQATTISTTSQPPSTPFQITDRSEFNISQPKKIKLITGFTAPVENTIDLSSGVDGFGGGKFIPPSFPVRPTEPWDFVTSQEEEFESSFEVTPDTPTSFFNTFTDASTPTTSKPIEWITRTTQTIPTRRTTITTTTRATRPPRTRRPPPSTRRRKPWIRTTTPDPSLAFTCNLLNCDFDGRQFMSLEAGRYQQFKLASNDTTFWDTIEGVTLKVCGGSKRTRLGAEFFRNCQRIIPELTVRNARRWNTARALILPQYTRLYLLAEHRGSNGHAALAIDDIRVLNCDQ